MRWSQLMIRGPFLFCAVCWLFILVNSTAQPAYAYVDPGSGLFLAQMVGSTFAGMLFLVRKRIRQFFGRFAGRFADPKGDAPGR
jgi:hypothetical protein